MDQPSSIPKWFKNKVNLWIGCEIKDKEFLKTMEEVTDSNLHNKSEQTSISEWFRQNTKWHIDEIISEKEFLNSIKYLVNQY